MKKRGFTLIELLAVIVVLAIIALIATPIVMNVIKNTQKSATERSAEIYLNAVETAIAADMLTDQRIADGTYTVDGDGNLVLDTKKLTVEVNGDLPKSGSKVGIKNGQVVVDGTNLDYGDYTVIIDSKGKASATEKENVVAEVLCTAIAPIKQSVVVEGAVDYEMDSLNVGVQATKASPYALGAVYSCDLGDGERIFYVLKEDGNNVKLLMNTNLGRPVAWCVSGNDNSCDADGANAVLVDRTKGWTKLFSVGGAVMLPTYDEMNSVNGNDWIRTNLFHNSDYETDDNYGGSYWTSNKYLDYVWKISWSGYPVKANLAWTTETGIRPVITISKSNMSL